MTDFEQAFLKTLQLYASALGTRRTAELCQQFILDTAFPKQQEQTPEPIPEVKAAEVTIKKVVPIKRKPVQVKVKVPEGTPEAKQQLQETVSPTPVKKKVKFRNFKKLVETGVLPMGTEVYPSAPEINPSTTGLIVKDPKGQPAIQASWDKSKYFTGTSSPPVKFLLEAQKRFPHLKVYVKENAWNEVLYKGSDGHYRMLSDA